MTDESARAAYNSPLRARQKAQTGQLILEAVATILRRAEVADVTIAEVARTAEVTERTVYRHYKTRDELLRAFWPWQLERMGGPYVNAPRSLDALLDALPRVFDGWDRDERLVRAVFFSADARAFRSPAAEQRRAALDGFVCALAPTAPEAERARLVAAILSLTSVTNWAFLRDVCGYAGRQAAEVAVTAIRLALKGLEQR
ncbi:TetR/AcrR family transcriptional regulator [Caulobacter sp. KR2-114]|uniref:TetR/AcrR family transcriptional regulator n=1 Tax=Caulobacter sp. KR2-114 TaxID=3400912 RepID=UPI003C0FFA0B